MPTNKKKNYNIVRNHFLPLPTFVLPAFPRPSSPHPDKKFLETIDTHTKKVFVSKHGHIH